MSMDVSKEIPIHKRCGTPVSTDEKDITPLDGDGERSGYSAACLKCDEDLFPFEVERVPASEACMTDGFFREQLMSRLLLILAWATVGGWTAATVRVATSPDADLTPIALAITAIFGALALWVTVRYERGERP